MPGADGSVWIKTEIDNADAQKELDKLQRDIAKIEKGISEAETKRNPLAEQAREYGAALDEAKAKLDALKSEQSSVSGILSGKTEVDPMTYADAFTRRDDINAEVKAQEKVVNDLQKQWDTVNRQVERYDTKIAEANKKLEEAKNAAGVLSEQITHSGSSSSAMAEAQERAQKSAARFASRLKEVVRSALLFTLITQALAKLREMLAANLKTSEEFRGQLARLKGAWLTAFQPVWSVIVPALTALMRLLTAIGAVLANVFSFFSGKSTSEMADNAKALNSEREALEGVGGAADDASKSLASFDEINKLSEPSGGGGGGSEIEMPDFAFTDDITDRLNRIAELVTLIGAGFALWKIGNVLPGTLGNILQFLGGILISAGGIALAFDGINDAWQNGVGWGNMAEILAGIALAAAGLYLAIAPLNAAFAKTAAGIILVVGGGAAIITAFKDIVENGVNLQNTLLLIGGIVATGLGFTFLTGSIIPLVVAGILSIITYVMSLTGHLEEFAENLKTNVLGGIITFISGVFTQDWDKAWSGLKDVFRGVFNGIIIMLESAVNFIIRGLNKISFSVPDWVPEIGGRSFGFNISEISLPRLATGAVIPPNREFMAVLGDQKSGYNIEAPEELIRRIVREETARGGNGNITLVFEGELAQLGALLQPYVKQEEKRVGVSLVTGGGFNR